MFSPSSYARRLSLEHANWTQITDTRQPLDNKTLSRLETAIHKSDYVSNGQKLKVVSKVNPEIRGGLVVEIGDRTIDLSVAAKMAKMNKLLRDTL